MPRVSLAPAFILHTQPYRDTSLLVHAFTQDYGKITGLARGVRRLKSPIRSLARPFIPLRMSWSGKTDLVSITQVEATGAFYHLSDRHLVSGLYLNELLMRLLHRYDPHPKIYAAYAKTLAQLHNMPEQLQPTLRRFEFDLLNDLGFGLQLHITYDTSKPVKPDLFYRVEPYKGVKEWQTEHDHAIFLGESLLCIQARMFCEKQTLLDAKRLIRFLLQPFLNGKPLRAYELLA